MSPWTKCYDVTIQMKVLCLYFHMVLFVFKILQNEIRIFLCNFAFLATIGSERVKQPHPKGIFPVILFLLFPSVDAQSLVPKKMSHLFYFLSVDAHKESCPRGIFPVVPGES